MQETVTQDREKYIGGSDEPAIMGISPFISRFDLLLQKCGLKENTFKGNEVTEYGNQIEPKIRAYINEHYNMHFVEDKVILNDGDVLPTRYHSDGYDKAESAVLEIKSTSDVVHESDVVGIDFREYAFKHYKKYLVQLGKGMYAHQAGYGWLAVYERPEDMSLDFDPERLQVFVTSFHEQYDLIDDVLKADFDFREDYKYLLENPFVPEAELPSRSPLVPIANKVMALESQIEQAQQIVKEYDELKKEMCAKMVEHGIKSWTMPSGTKVTLVPQGQDKTVEKFNEKKFATENPRLYEEYLEEKTQKGKSAYVRITLQK